MGTDIVVWTPYSLTRSARVLFQLSHWSRRPEATVPTMVRPATSESACGEVAGYTSEWPGLTTASGLPGSTDWWAARRSSTGAASLDGGSPFSCGSSRSMLTKSASAGMHTSASSWAVRVTSRVVPMRTLASLTS